MTLRYRDYSLLSTGLLSALLLCACAVPPEPAPASSAAVAQFDGTYRGRITRSDDNLACSASRDAVLEVRRGIARLQWDAATTVTSPVDVEGAFASTPMGIRWPLSLSGRIDGDGARFAATAEDRTGRTASCRWTFQGSRT